MRESKDHLRVVETVPPPKGRPVIEILQEIFAHLSEIVRSQILLVGLNVRDDIAARKNAALSIAVANILILYGGAFLILGVVFALATVLPPWLAAISVGAVVGTFGTIILAVGIRKLKNPKAT